MKRNQRKIIMVLTIVTTLITIITVSWEFIMRMYIQNKFQIRIDKNSVSSIGIIGGSDGPTAIFISGNQYLGIIKYIFGLLSFIGIVYLVITSKVKRRKK
ncbi:MAG: sodium ion-translocating decarboxylase subunit beta [Clostridiales bacterium]|nr:sodium ion-translocating decarboxylase subunit beta [Clostridiales bacterium]